MGGIASRVALRRWYMDRMIAGWWHFRLACGEALEVHDVLFQSRGSLFLRCEWCVCNTLCVGVVAHAYTGHIIVS